ncbi:camelysin-like metallo-endopeptidase [Halopolyspora algeriensis]|uniref:Camelysin-like metallo-endopeptidase n=1 Tax=Halopolyspora algeriensis TaxID=1500506 RepID=A0A368VU34_9ACTN|nr:TasA family protein [Halopolyspora algeriensis]RCW45265.1 camelysin-like metallo-endopeptidase [Halopolyspora algeriensis]TQM53016.1 camelysin-like metallo-endopeptidase [Halopolyspora algeriensis]
MRNKKLAAGIGGVTAVAAAVAISAGTFAAFSDTEQRGVVATGGTMDLQITNSQYGDVFGENGIVDVGTVSPGETVGKAKFTAKNAGDVAGNLSIDLQALKDDGNGFTGPEEGADGENGVDGASEGELLENLVLTINGGGNSHTLEDLDDISVDNLATLEGGESINYTLKLSVKDAGNEIQGDTAKFKMVANLDQVQN